MNLTGDIPDDVIAAQFAAGLSIRRLAMDWGLDEAMIELAIRSQFRMLIPRRAGGDKPSRTEVRAMRSARRQAARRAQSTLGW